MLTSGFWINTAYIAIDVLYMLYTKIAAQKKVIKIMWPIMKGVTLGRPHQLCTYLDVVLKMNNVLVLNQAWLPNTRTEHHNIPSV